MIEGTVDITATLARICAGDPRAVDEVTLLLSTELRGTAAGHLQRKRDGHPLESMALVREAYVRLVGQRDVFRSVAVELFRVAELRSFGGLTIEETAEALGISASSVDRAWSTVRALLRRHMRSEARS